MKTRFTVLFILVVSGVVAQTPRQRPRWQIPDHIARRLVSEPRRMYLGFDLGYYRSQASTPAGGRTLQAFRLKSEVFPGLTVGWHLSRRLSLETGLYNLPSTIAYSVEVNQRSFAPAGLGIQYAMVPLRLRYRAWQPLPRLRVSPQAGVAVAFNSNIHKGKFEQLNSMYPPVLGDTVEVTDQAVMIHNVTLLLEGGLEVGLKLSKHVEALLYGRAVLGLQPLWRNEASYLINQQEPPGHVTLTARANGLTAGLGLRYTFRVGRRWRTVWE